MVKKKSSFVHFLFDLKGKTYTELNEYSDLNT